MLTGDMLRRSAERFPDKPAVLWQDTSMSYSELNIAANRLANALISEGAGKGVHIGILSRNRTEYAISFFGVARTGAVIVNISVLYAPDELQFVLDKADIEILFFDELFEEKIAAVKDDLPKLKRLIRIGSDGDDTFKSFIDNTGNSYPNIDIHEDDPFCMTYTGGTTGRPKGVLTSHRNRAITAHTVMVEEAIDERDVVGIVTPMFHVAALNIMYQPAILAGATVTLLSKWDVADFAKMVRQNKMTAAFMVPTQVAMVISDPDFDADNFSSWRKLSFAGAPMPDWVQRDMLDKLPNVKLTQIYGQSEVGVLTSLRYWYLPEKLGSVGRQAYNVDVSVVDPDGNPVAPGVIGEIVSKGDNVMLEYYNEPEQTAGFFHHGWGWTGDVGTIDEDGFITLIDRSKDMIISGGENVYPKEIENVLYEHPAVAECAVFGVPDDKWGEVPIAQIVLKSGMTVDQQELIDHCAGHLARFKRPRSVDFVNSFPKTPIGKIQKNLLREAYWKERDKKI
ncbi:MAG: long-chain-fatty-acid--CoA ligase [marine bacterium B5-7]|nr:MAG: long-chain-fatty-acid--CoA ligase [marine bacterium B5-7]